MEDNDQSEEEMTDELDRIDDVRRARREMWEMEHELRDMEAETSILHKEDLVSAEDAQDTGLGLDRLESATRESGRRRPSGEGRPTSKTADSACTPAEASSAAGNSDDPEPAKGGGHRSPEVSSSHGNDEGDAVVVKKSSDNTTTTTTTTEEEEEEEKPEGGKNEGGGDEEDWPEPTLADLDRSIPQVDCEFIANLIRCRNLHRSDFLRRKQQVKSKVEELTQRSTASVTRASRLPRLGGTSFWRRGPQDTEDTALTATSEEEPVVTSPEVLAQLSPEELDLLHTTRPEYDDGFILLDCRTVNEVTSWGIIEGAKVLPAHELFAAFHATPDDFREAYGFEKPRPDDMIICYCQYGPRSLMAAQILSWMGYLKVLHFRDGYFEWGKQYNLLLRRWMRHDKESGNELRRLATFQAALEMQRAVAPEFNALPQQEADRYRIDTTRSRGTLRIGDGLRAEAYAAVATLVETMPPHLLPPPGQGEGDGIAGGLDVSDDGTGGGGGDGASAGSSAGGVREQHVMQFLSEATGLDPSVTASARTLEAEDAQTSLLGALGRGIVPGRTPTSRK